MNFKKWVQYHRCHHRYMETDADPHNSQRGFFFSHIGWLMIQKTPDASRRLKEVDMSDMEADPVIRFCDKYVSLCIIEPINCSKLRIIGGY